MNGQGPSAHGHRSWAGFVGTGLGTLAVALPTAGFQSIKAASASPVSALKYE